MATEGRAPEDLEILDDIPRRRRITLGADKGDVVSFVDELRKHDVTPHVARKIR